MPKVTSVEPQKKSPHRFNIYLDGQFAFGADEDVVVEQRLISGKEINPADLEKLLFEVEIGKLMERMYGLFNVRLRSEKEVRDYLKNLSFKRKTKGKEEIGEVVINQLIDKLKKKDLINDVAFARAWTESRSRKKGKQLIKQELFQKGIDRKIIEEVLNQSESLSKENGFDVASALLEKKLRIWQTLPYLEKKKKATDFLMRRGFEYDVVKDVIEKMIKKDYN